MKIKISFPKTKFSFRKQAKNIVWICRLFFHNSSNESGGSTPYSETLAASIYGLLEKTSITWEIFPGKQRI